MAEVGAAHFEGEDLVSSGGLTVSVGVACFPEHANDAQELILHADQALYTAKNRGKNTILIWEPLRPDLRMRISVSGTKSFFRGELPRGPFLFLVE